MKTQNLKKVKNHIKGEKVFKYKIKNQNKKSKHKNKLKQQGISLKNKFPLKMEIVISLKNHLFIKIINLCQDYRN